MTCHICAGWQSNDNHYDVDEFEGDAPIRSIPKDRLNLGSDCVEIDTPYGPEYLLRHGAAHCDVNPNQVFAQFGTWAVTDYGIECLTHYYPIKKERLGEGYWPQQMHRKQWVNQDDFLLALKVGRRHHSRRVAQLTRLIPKAVRALFANADERPSAPQRFYILKRDNYRCQICGRTAKDNVKLEVDHIVPVAKGGKTIEENLWVLCYPCNRGKGTQDL